MVREDSISIESQIERCIYEARGEDYVVYQDNGFSGKDTDRPDFKRMLKDIQQRLINKVIVYKLDRNVVEILIHKITVYKDVVEINWKV